MSYLWIKGFDLNWDYGKNNCSLLHHQIKHLQSKIRRPISTLFRHIHFLHFWFCFFPSFLFFFTRLMEFGCLENKLLFYMRFRVISICWLWSCFFFIININIIINTTGTVSMVIHRFPLNRNHVINSSLLRLQLRKHVSTLCRAGVGDVFWRDRHKHRPVPRGICSSLTPQQPSVSKALSDTFIVVTVKSIISH